MRGVSDDELDSIVDDFFVPGTERKLSELKAALRAYVAHHTKEAVERAETQAIMNMGVRLRYEFMRRDLTPDSLPKGYRKMSNDELVAKVANEMLAELAADEQKRGGDAA